MENFVCIFSKTKGHPGDHVKMVHEGILIIWGLRSPNDKDSLSGLKTKVEQKMKK